MAYRTAFGPVKIIPASAFRQHQYVYTQHVQPDYPSSSEQQQQQQQQQPINIGYYMAGGYYNAGFVPPGYEGQSTFLDNYSAHYYGGAETTYGGPSGAYRAYPQPQPSPPYRRSRTAPVRTLPRAPAYTRYKGARGYSVPPPEPVDYRYYRSFSGPLKRPAPLYRKRRPQQRPQPAYQETEFIERPPPTAGIPSGYYYGGVPPPTEPVQQQPTTAPTLRRVRPTYYSPSYTSYPPSTMFPNVPPPQGAMLSERHLKNSPKYVQKKYPLFARIALKFAQLILGAAILGLVLGPMRGTSFHDFVIRTNTEWQGAVVGIVAVFAILTLLMLLTVFLANSQHFWRQLDALISAIAIILYLLASFLEAYYAACYPPNGPKINLVCHRAEWIIACILLFFNTVFYIIDFTLAWRTGVNLL